MTNKLQYLGSVILSASIPEEYPTAWGGMQPEITIMAAGGISYDEDGRATCFAPSRSVTVTFYRGCEAEIDALIETLQAIKACIAPPKWVDDNPLEY